MRNRGAPSLARVGTLSSSSDIDTVAMAVDDFALWRRAREGDLDAFAALFRRYADRIYNYCFRRVGNWGPQRICSRSSSSRRGGGETSRSRRTRCCPGCMGSQRVSSTIVAGRSGVSRPLWRAYRLLLPSPTSERTPIAASTTTSRSSTPSASSRGCRVTSKPCSRCVHGTS